MKLQLALDDITLDDAVELLDKVHTYVDLSLIHISGIHENHVLKHSKNEEILVSHFANQQACTDHSHDNNSRGKNPSRYHNQAGKSSGHICSQ